jgi:glucose/mannose-6-phosphate isomerase
VSDISESGSTRLLLDDSEALALADPGDMLRQVASGAAQVRESRLRTAETGIGAITAEGRPRAIIVAGTGLEGEMLAAVCGTGCPVPIVAVRGHQLPGWVGAADLVVAVSCSGHTEETLAVATEAARRGCRMLCVGGASAAVGGEAGSSPLADIAVQYRAPFVAVRSVGQSRSSLWATAVPVLLAGQALGLADVSDEVLETVAERLEEISHQCRPSSESFLNPGKQLALEFADTIPMVWGTSPLTGTAARRFARQLETNAKVPALHGEIPDVMHDQVETLGVGEDDFFRDREADPSGSTLRLVLIRDTAEHPKVTQAAEFAAGLARDHGVPITELVAQGEHPLVRLAGLLALADYASVYLALSQGVDPTPQAGAAAVR